MIIWVALLASTMLPPFTFTQIGSGEYERLVACGYTPTLPASDTEMYELRVWLTSSNHTEPYEGSGSPIVRLTEPAEPGVRQKLIDCDLPIVEPTILDWVLWQRFLGPGSGL